MKFKNILQNTTWIDGCIVRFAESREMLMDVLYAFESSSVYTVNYKAKVTILRGALKSTKKDKKTSRTPIRRNAIFKEILMDVSRLLHPRRV